MDGRSGLIKVAVMLDAEALLGQLCAISLRLLCGELGAHKQGLSAAARAAFQQGFIGSRTKKKLLEVDTAHQYARHVTAEKVAEFVAELRAELLGSSLSGREVGGFIVDDMKSNNPPDHCDSTFSDLPSTDCPEAKHDEQEHGHEQEQDTTCEDVKEAERFDIHSDTEDSTADESGSASCVVWSNDINVQTELTFPLHTLACHVASSADDMIEFGLAALAQSSLDAASECRAKVDSILAEVSKDANDIGGDARLEELTPNVLYDEVQSFVFDKTAVQRARAAMTNFQAAAESFAVHCSFDGLDASDSTTKKALKLRAKRRRKRIDTVLTNVTGGDIVEARVNVKAIPLEDLLALEELFHVEDRVRMKPSRRRRRLAWIIWLHADPEREQRERLTSLVSGAETSQRETR
jgi:hypothetical protein